MRVCLTLVDYGTLDRRVGVVFVGTYLESVTTREIRNLFMPMKQEFYPSGLRSFDRVFDASLERF